MESNLRDGNNSDSDGHLPPRKRLLAGLKKRNLGKKPENLSSSKEKVVSDPRIDSFMDYLIENPNLSLEEIVEESRRGADVAAKRAVAARAVAEEKAIVAAKKMAKAKRVLKLIADVSDELDSRNWQAKKKNKMKRQRQAKKLHMKQMSAENCKTNEDLARHPHHTMNSSKRIVEDSANSDLKIYENKRAKGLSILESPRVNIYGNGVSETEDRETDSEDLTGEARIVGVLENSSKWAKDNLLRIVNGEAESSHSKERILESSNDFTTKGGAMKQKKLPLHECSSKDLSDSNNEIRSKKHSIE